MQVLLYIKKKSKIVFSKAELCGGQCILRPCAALRYKTKMTVIKRG